MILGIKEEEILNYPMDKFYLYSAAARRSLRDKRKLRILDTAAAIGGVFTKGGIAKQLEALDEE